MDYTKLLEQSPKILFAILIGGLLFLVAPASVLGSMSLDDFWLRPYIGIVTILSGALLVTHGATFLIGWLKTKRSKRKEEEKWQETLVKTFASLTPAEKDVLRPYILANENSCLFNISDGVAGGLAAKQILYRASNLGYMGNFPYNLQTWAREYLEQHPELLR